MSFILWFLALFSLCCFIDIVDIKPEVMEDLSVVITSAAFNPKVCSQFVYATSKGSVELCDLRDSAICDGHSKCLL